MNELWHGEANNFNKKLPVRTAIRFSFNDLPRWMSECESDGYDHFEIKPETDEVTNT